MKKIVTAILGLTVFMVGCSIDDTPKKPYSIDVFSLGVDADRAVFKLTYENTGDKEVVLRANDGEMVDVMARDRNDVAVYDSREVGDVEVSGVRVYDVVIGPGETHEFVRDIPIRYFDVGDYTIDMVLRADVPEVVHEASVSKFSVTEFDLNLSGESESPYADTRDRGVFTFSGVVDSHSIELIDENGDYLVMGVTDELRDLYSKVEIGLIIEFDYENHNGRFVIVSDYDIAD